MRSPVADAAHHFNVRLAAAVALDRRCIVRALPPYRRTEWVAINSREVAKARLSAVPLEDGCTILIPPVVAAAAGSVNTTTLTVSSFGRAHSLHS